MDYNICKGAVMQAAGGICDGRSDTDIGVLLRNRWKSLDHEACDVCLGMAREMIGYCYWLGSVAPKDVPVSELPRLYRQWRETHAAVLRRFIVGPGA